MTRPLFSLAPRGKALKSYRDLESNHGGRYHKEDLRKLAQRFRSFGMLSSSLPRTTRGKVLEPH